MDSSGRGFGYSVTMIADRDIAANGAINSGYNVGMFAGGNITVGDGGSITSNWGAINLNSGTSANLVPDNRWGYVGYGRSKGGGDITLGIGSSISANNSGAELRAYAGSVSGIGGNITQYGVGSSIYGHHTSLYADRNIDISGSVGAYSGTWIEAGVGADRGASGPGGSIHVRDGASISAGEYYGESNWGGQYGVELIAHQGTEAATGNISLEANTSVTSYGGGYYPHSVEIIADRDITANGSISGYTGVGMFAGGNIALGDGTTSGSGAVTADNGAISINSGAYASLQWSNINSTSSLTGGDITISSTASLSASDSVSLHGNGVGDNGNVTLDAGAIITSHWGSLYIQSDHDAAINGTTTSYGGTDIVAGGNITLGHIATGPTGYASLTAGGSIDAAVEDDSYELGVGTSAVLFAQGDIGAGGNHLDIQGPDITLYSAHAVGSIGADLNSGVPVRTTSTGFLTINAGTTFKVENVAIGDLLSYNGLSLSMHADKIGLYSSIKAGDFAGPSYVLNPTPSTDVDGITVSANLAGVSFGGDLTLAVTDGNLSFGDVGQIVGGALSLNASGKLSQTSGSIDLGYGHPLYLDAGGDIKVNGITAGYTGINQNNNLFNTHGAVTILGDIVTAKLNEDPSTLRINGNGISAYSINSGDVTLESNAGISIGSMVASAFVPGPVSSSGNITMTASDGDVLAGVITVGSDSASVTISANSGNILVDSVTATGGYVGLHANGNIENTATTLSPTNITAGTVNLSSENGHIAADLTGTTDLTLTVNAASDGGFAVTSNTDLTRLSISGTYSSLTGSTLTLVSDSQGIEFSADGSRVVGLTAYSNSTPFDLAVKVSDGGVYASSIATYSGKVNLSARDSIVIGNISTLDDSGVGAPVFIRSTNGSILSTGNEGGGYILSGTAAVTLAADLGSVGTGTGPLDRLYVQTTSTLSQLSIWAQDEVNVGVDFSGSAGNVSQLNLGVNGSGSGAINIAANDLPVGFLTRDGSGKLTLSGGGGNAFPSTSTLTDLSIVGRDGNLIVDGVASGALNNLTLVTAGDLTVNGSITNGSGTLALQAGAKNFSLVVDGYAPGVPNLNFDFGNPGNVLTGSHAISSGGDIRISAGGSISEDAVGSIHADGRVTLLAAHDVTLYGDVISNYNDVIIAAGADPANVSGGPSGYGGDVVIGNGTDLARVIAGYGSGYGQVNVRAHAGTDANASLGGTITLAANTQESQNQIYGYYTDLSADRNVNIYGSVGSYDGTRIEAGVGAGNGSGGPGGSILVYDGGNVSAGGVGDGYFYGGYRGVVLLAHAGTDLANGDITLETNSTVTAYGGGYYPHSVEIIADRDIKANGSISGNYGVGMFAGHDITVGDGSTPGSGAITASDGTISLYSGVSANLGEGRIGYDGHSSTGGDITIKAGASLQASSWIELNGYGATGGGTITLEQDSSVTSNGGWLDIYADRNAVINGTVTSIGSGIYIEAGNSAYGGNLELGTSSLVSANSIHLGAYAGSESDTGNIFQYGGQINSGNYTSLYADRNITISGQIHASGNYNSGVSIQAGQNDGSGLGGSILVTGTGDISSTGYDGTVLRAYKGSDTNSGSITLDPGSLIAATNGSADSTRYGYSTVIVADRDIKANGSISGHYGVGLFAGRDISVGDGTTSNSGTIESTNGSISLVSGTYAYLDSGTVRSAINPGRYGPYHGNYQSPSGGNITINSASGSGGYLYAENRIGLYGFGVADNADSGNIKINSGSKIVANGGYYSVPFSAVDLIGARDVTVDGSVTSIYGHIYIAAGQNPSTSLNFENGAAAASGFGGNVVISGTVDASSGYSWDYGAVAIRAFANPSLAATDPVNSQGNITIAFGAGVIAGSHSFVDAVAEGNVTIGGSVSGYEMHFAAGGNGENYYGNESVSPSLRGGDIVTESTSSLNGGFDVHLYASVGTVSTSSNVYGGNITQDGSIDIKPVSGGSGRGFVYISGARDVTINGSITNHGNYSSGYSNDWIGAGQHDNNVAGGNAWGGNLVIGSTANIQNDGGAEIKLYGFADATTGGALRNGSISFHDGAQVHGGYIEVRAMGDIKIGDSPTGNTGSVDIGSVGGLPVGGNYTYFKAGYNDDTGESSASGGNITLNNSAHISSGYVDLYAGSTYRNNTGLKGNITQYNGSTIDASSGEHVGIYADGTVSLDGSIGSLAAPGSIDIFSGIQNWGMANGHGDDANMKYFHGNGFSEGDNNYSGQFGGDINLGANSAITGGYVQMVANRGWDFTSGGNTGNISQDASGILHTTGSEGGLKGYAAGNLALKGTTTIDNGASVKLYAGIDFPNWIESAYPGKNISIGAFSAPASTVYLYASGAIETADPTAGIAAGSVYADAATGITLTGATNAIDTLSASNSTSGNINVSNTAALSLGKVTTSGGGTITVNAAGLLTLNDVVSSDASGDAVSLVGTGIDSGTNGGSITTPNGRWLVWSSTSDPRTDNLGLISDPNSLAYNYSFTQYNAPYSLTTPTTVLGSGNGLLYSLDPGSLLSLTISGPTTKFYDGTKVAPSGFSASLTGTPIGNVTVMQGSTLYDSPHAGLASSLTLAVTVTDSLDSTKPVYNYFLPAATSVSASINQLALGTSASITAAAKTYDGLLAATGSTVSGSVTGTVGGDIAMLNTSGISLNYSDAHVVGAKTISATGSVAIGTFTGVGAGLKDGSSAGNEVAGLSTDYSVSLPTISPVAGTINALTLGSSASITAAAKTYDGLLAATGSTVSGNVTGTVGGDTMTLNTSGISLNYSDAHVVGAKTISATGSVAIGTFTGVGAGLKDGSSAGNEVVGLGSDYGPSVTQPTINPVAGTINARTLGSSASITAVAKTYDGLLAATGSTVSGSVTGTVGGDMATLNTSGISLTYSNAHVVGAKTISATGSVALGTITGVGAGSKDGSSAGNEVAGLATDYAAALTQPTISPVAGTINALTLGSSASITAVAKTYDGLLAATGSTVNGSVTGTVGGDIATLNTSGISLTYSDAHVVGAKTITATGSLALGSFTGVGAGTKLGFSAGNEVAGLATDYSVSLPTINPVAGSITAKVLTASLTNTGITKPYDGTTTASFTPTYSVSGLLSGDTAASFTTTSKDYNNAHVASASYVMVGGLSISGITTGGLGSLASDYSLGTVTSLSSAASSASISPSVLTVSGNWSTPASWIGSLLPQNTDLLGVLIPASTNVAFDGVGGPTSVPYLTSSGKLSMTGGALTVTGAFSTVDYSQSAGTLTAASVGINSAGIINQSGGSLITPSMTTVSVGGTTLSGANAIGSIQADNSGSGDITLTNTGALTIAGITNSAGNIVVANSGPVSMSGSQVYTSTGTVTFDVLNASSLTLDNSSVINGNRGVFIGASGVSLNHTSTIQTGPVATANVEMVISEGDITLDNGSSILAAHDAIFTLTGPTAQVVLNSAPGEAPSSIKTEAALTTHVNFLNRTSGGFVIDGTPGTTTTDGGSGIYALGKPATVGNGLVIVYPSSGGSSNDVAAQVIDQYFAEMTQITSSSDETDATSDDDHKKKGNKGDNEGDNHNEHEHGNTGQCNA